MTCTEIEKRLPAYMEDLLSPEEKKGIDDHLGACPHCCKALDDLKRTQACLKGLDEVDPPPFFEQRIMARVREEAAQKRGILRKLFYPLYVKIPIQALATILVAVLAVYVYQKGEPEMRQIAPLPVPMIESEKDRPAMKSKNIPTSSSAAAPSRKRSAGDLAGENHQHFAPPPFASGEKADGITGSPAPIREDRALAAKPAPPAMTAKDKEAEPPAGEVMHKAQVVSGNQDAGRSFEALRPERKLKQDGSDAGNAALKSERLQPVPSRAETRTAAKPPTFDLTIQVRNMDAAILEIERRIGQVNARMIERQHFDGRELLKVDMAARDIDAFLDRLGTIGRVKPEKPSPAIADGQVIIRISIVVNP